MALIDFNKWLWEFYGIGYEALNLSLPHKKIRKAIRENVENLYKNLNILDAGCGTGTLLLELSQSDKNSKFTGIDFSNVMIFFARLKLRLHREKNVKILKYSLNNKLPIRSGSEDIIISINTLFALDKPKLALAEFYRILSKKGLLIIVTPLPNFSYLTILKAHFSELLQLPFHRQIIIMTLTILYLPLFVLIFLSNILITLNEKLGKYSQYNKSKIIKILKDCGFFVTSVRKIAVGQEWMVCAVKR